MFFISNLIANIQLYQCDEELKVVKDAMRNGYMFAKSNCRNDYISSWNTQNIADELKLWFKSMKPSKNRWAATKIENRRDYQDQSEQLSFSSPLITLLFHHVLEKT